MSNGKQNGTGAPKAQQEAMAPAPRQTTKVREVEPEVEIEDDNPMGYPRFASTTGEAVMLALTRGGHSASIGTMAQTNNRGTPLHPRFHRLAGMRGCLPVSAIGSFNAYNEEGGIGNIANNRQSLVLKAINDMVAAAAEDPTLEKELFTDDGRPNAMQIGARVGFPVTTVERDNAWAAYAGDGDDA